MDHPDWRPQRGHFGLWVPLCGWASCNMLSTQNHAAAGFAKAGAATVPREERRNSSRRLVVHRADCSLCQVSTAAGSLSVMAGDAIRLMYRGHGAGGVVRQGRKPCRIQRASRNPEFKCVLQLIKVFYPHRRHRVGTTRGQVLQKESRAGKRRTGVLRLREMAAHRRVCSSPPSA